MTRKKKTGWLPTLKYEGNGKKWSFVLDQKPMTKPELASSMEEFFALMQQKSLKMTLHFKRVR